MIHVIADSLCGADTKILSYVFYISQLPDIIDEMIG